MWRRLKNIFHSFRTYADLTPDIQTRQRINRLLNDRPGLSQQEWYLQFWKGQNISEDLAGFIYERMPTYSGLDFSRVQPGDRLNADLQLPLVCWFDWHISFCEDFMQVFGIDLSNHFDPDSLTTVADLLLFLNQQVVSASHSP